MPEDADEQAGAAAVAPGAPCGACRTLRRRCVPGCVFAPYFTAEDFAAAHAVFGASNVSKMLERVEHPEQRRVAAATIVEEARARAADPTFGRVSYLRILQEVNDKASKQVDDARAQIAREFGALAASQPVDVAAAPPEVWVEARAQVDAALKHARELDVRLLGVRKANEIRWRELHPEGGTGNGKGIDAKRHREPTMLMPRAAKLRRPPPGFPDERSHQQMAAAEAEREKAMLMRQQAAAHAKQHGHHLAVQHGETQPPRVPEVCGNGQMHQQMSEASREEAMRSVHLDSAGQHAGRTGQTRRAGDDAAGRTPGQGTTSVLLEAMMQLAGAGDKQQQHLMVQHTENKHDITQEMLQLQELLDMAELARPRKQQIMKNDVMMEIGQWDTAAGHAMEQDVMTMMQQQIPANMTGNMSEQFAWAQQYHDPAAAHHASPWLDQMLTEEHHQPAAAFATQVASEQDMLLLLQQHQVAAVELLSAGGARQFVNLAAHHDDTELTLGYVLHPDDMHQQEVAAGQFAGVQDMNSLHAAAAVLAEQEMMQHQHHQHAQNGLDIIALGNGYPDAETQAMLQELAAILDLGGKQDVMTMTSQHDPDAAWLLEKLEQLEKESMEKREMIVSRQAEARHAQKQLSINLGNGSDQGNLQRQQELFAMAERERKLEMLMRQFVAAGRAREQELIAQAAAAAAQQQHEPVAQYSEKERKLEMLMRQVVAVGRAREQELITQQAAAAQQQQPVAQQYSGTEPDISSGQGHGHPYWHQPTAQQMLQEQELPTVQQMLQEQQLADAVGFGRHQPNTTSAQQVTNGEHGSGAGATMAFLSPGSAKDAPFLADQQWQPNGHQMDSSLPRLPPSSSQLHAQVSHQQRTDGGGQGLNSDLAAYLHY